MSPKKTKVAEYQKPADFEGLKICKTDHKIASEAVQKAASTMQKACESKKKIK